MTDLTYTPQPAPTREGWLLEAAELLWPRIVEAGGTRPAKCRVSCGWPSSTPLMRPSSARRTLGEAWHGGSDDGAREVFITPALADPVAVLDVLAHELVHAACEPGQGHGPIFAAICRKIGLTENKPTQAAAGDKMRDELADMARSLGRYPHSKLDRLPGQKQETRQKLVLCPDCGCKARMARTWIDTYLPTCGCGTRMVSEEHETVGEPLRLETSHVEYTTVDRRFRLATSKVGKREGKWTVTMLADEDGNDLLGADVRVTVRHSREDALAFIAAIREGVTDFPETDVTAEEWDDDDEADLGELDDWTATDDDLFLSDDEDEAPDYPEDMPVADDDVPAELTLAERAKRFTTVPATEAEYAAMESARDAAGERKSASIAAGTESATD